MKMNSEPQTENPHTPACHSTSLCERFMGEGGLTSCPAVLQVTHAGRLFYLLRHSGLLLIHLQGLLALALSPFLNLMTFDIQYHFVLSIV